MERNGSKYLKKERLIKSRKDGEIRTLIKLKCENMKKDNKYWVEEEGICLL